MNDSTYKTRTITANNLSAIKKIRFLTENTFVLTLDRKGLQFKAGQYITVGLKDALQHREYSVYSAENDNLLEILVREVMDGDVSLQLKHCKPGQLLEVNGPFGYLKLNSEDMYSKQLIFIASGTGIAPFHSFITSYPGIDYLILHGVRNVNEAYDKKDYEPQRYILCSSRERNGNFYGRVTNYLQSFRIKPDMSFYLCGNSNMIYDVYNILRKKEVPPERIHSEVYF
jgi:ferredoxin/flavodoxin---NADP+ reductase